MSNNTEKLSKTSIIITIVILIIAAYAFYFGGQKGTTLIDREDIQITQQENFYGISGRISEVRDDSIVIETPALPYDDYNPKPGDRWTWTVFIDGDTEVFKVVSDEHGSVEDGDNITLVVSATEILKAGDFVNITSKSDIGIQFAFDEKYIRAIKIKAR